LQLRYNKVFVRDRDGSAGNGGARGQGGGLSGIGGSVASFVGGGALAAVGSIVELTGCQLQYSNVTQGSGGAIRAFFTTLSLTDCSLTSNVAMDVTQRSSVGGCGHVDGKSQLTLQTGSFQFNQADLGGCFAVADSVLRFERATFVENEAWTGNGGALLVIDCEGVVERCGFVSNRARLGGGGAVFVQGPAPEGLINRTHPLEPALGNEYEDNVAEYGPDRASPAEGLRFTGSKPPSGTLFAPGALV
jgi:hypothetical protein